MDTGCMGARISHQIQPSSVARCPRAVWQRRSRAEGLGTVTVVAPCDGDFFLLSRQTWPRLPTRSDCRFHERLIGTRGSTSGESEPPVISNPQNIATPTEPLFIGVSENDPPADRSNTALSQSTGKTILREKKESISEKGKVSQRPFPCFQRVG